jgi:hypothetical protein
MYRAKCRSTGYSSKIVVHHSKSYHMERDFSRLRERARAWCKAVVPYSHFSTTVPEPPSGIQYKPMPQVQLIPGLEQFSLVTIALALTLPDSLEPIFSFHTKIPDECKIPPENFLAKSELNLSEAVSAFLNGCSYNSEESYVLDRWERFRQWRLVNWWDRTGRVSDTFSHFFSPDVHFSRLVFTEEDLENFPVIVQMDNPRHLCSQLVYRFDGVRDPDFLERDLLPLPGLLDLRKRGIPPKVDAAEEQSDSDDWDNTPRAISVQWVIGSRQGVNLLWIFQYGKVYEIGDQKWKSYDRSDFTEQWATTGVRIYFVSYGYATYMTVNSYNLPNMTPPVRIYRDSTDKLVLDFLKTQSDFEIPYPPLSVDWAKTFLKQSILFPCFYLKNCGFADAIGFSTTMIFLFGITCKDPYDDPVMTEYPNSMTRRDEKDSKQKETPDLHRAYVAYTSFCWCTLEFIKFLEFLCKEDTNSDMLRNKFASVMGSLPWQAPLLVRFILSLFLEIAITLETKWPGEWRASFANIIRQGLAIAVGADYGNKLKPGTAKTANDDRWSAEHSESKFQPPEASVDASDFISPEELVKRMERVLSTGSIYGEREFTLLNLIGQFKPPLTDFNNENIESLLTTAYLQYLQRYRAPSICRL